MRHLVIYSHPNPRSFNHAILETYVASVKELGDEVRVRDLYRLSFDPILSGDDLARSPQDRVAPEIREEHGHISWADIITFVFPLWWGGMPAIAKGYMDRVFCEGFAYRFSEKGLERLLTGKRALTITTLGDSKENYENSGFIEAMDRLLDGIAYDFSGIQSMGHIYFGSVVTVSHETRQEMLSEVRERVRSLKQST